MRLEERRLKLGQYFFQRHGGKVVFFGHFVAVLVIAGALLFARQNERRPEDEAERALAGPLDEYQPGGLRDRRPV